MKTKLVWEEESLLELYQLPLIQLIGKACEVHQSHFNLGEVQVSTLVSIKTGGCPEDCHYCPQSARYNTSVERHALMDVEEVKKRAIQAKQQGSSRLCLGAAWREVKSNADFDRVLNMVKQVSDIGLEVCCTLGMLNEEQAHKLKEAGLHAYNHNIDTGPSYYSKIITTRKFEDRLKTIENVRKADLTVCSGGIIGMGETKQDRVQMIMTLANLDPQPESIPINMLVPVAGTPLEEKKENQFWDLVRTIATARIVFPKSFVRLSAGRVNLSASEQALCFLAGANSIFAGEKLLTTPNNAVASDQELFALLGLAPMNPKKFEDKSGSISCNF